MATVKLILTIIQVLGAVFLTFVVLAQSGKSAGLSGAIAGGADTFLSKNKAKSWDAKLARWTKWVAIGFMILTMVLTLSEQEGVLFCCAGAFCVILESTVMRYKGDHPFYEFTRNLPGLLQGLRLFHP